MPQAELDAIDRRILGVLQGNARISNVDLAAQVGVSPSPCWRRVRALEESGVIAGYVALLDQSAVGLKVSVFVQVSLEKQVERALEAFEREHHHAPDAHEKARLLSETVKEWEHEEVEATHPGTKLA